VDINAPVSLREEMTSGAPDLGIGAEGVMVTLGVWEAKRMWHMAR
jgi:hypothetical protein